MTECRSTRDSDRDRLLGEQIRSGLGIEEVHVGHVDGELDPLAYSRACSRVETRRELNASIVGDSTGR